MRVRTFSVLLVVMAIAYIMSVASEVFVDDFVKPHTLFSYLLFSTLITSIAALAIDIDVPS